MFARVDRCRFRLDRRTRCVAVLLLLCVATPLLGACVGPKAVIRFRPPSATDAFTPVMAEPDRQPLTVYLSRDLQGVPADRLREQLLGPPHATGTTTSGDVWFYTFVRTPLGRQSVPDARLIGRQPAGYPESFRLAVVLEDQRVTNSQILWFENRPALAFEVESVLGRPDRRETTSSGEIFTYRFTCLTQGEHTSGAVTYRLSNAHLRVPFEAEGNVAGTDLIVTDQTRLTVRPDGSTEDPSTGVTWNMRPNLGGGEVNRATPVDVLASDISQISTPGAVQAVFGWPSDTISRVVGSETLTFAIYPLERARSVPARLVVTYATSGDRTVVRNVGIHWQNGLPRDPANLKLHLGSPDRTIGSPAGNRENWIYDYRIAARPPLVGTPHPITYGLRLTFTVRGGVEVKSTVEMERTSLTQRRRR